MDYHVFIINPQWNSAIFGRLIIWWDVRSIPCVSLLYSSTCCSCASGCLLGLRSPPSLLLFLSPTPPVTFSSSLSHPRSPFLPRPEPVVNQPAVLSFLPIDSVHNKGGGNWFSIISFFFLISPGRKEVHIWIGLMQSRSYLFHTCSSWALGMTRSSSSSSSPSSSPSSSSRSSCRVSSSSSGLGALKVKGRLQAHTSPIRST